MIFGVSQELFTLNKNQLIVGSADIENQIEHLDNHSNVKIELYDLYTNDTFLRAPFRQRRQPCECTGYKCSCCAGMNIKVFNFNRKREYKWSLSDKLNVK